MVVPLEIKNQGILSDFCTGCVIASIAEEYLGEPCDESYSYAAAKHYGKRPVEERGVKAKYALMGAVEYGVLPKSKSPYSIATHSRDFLADWNNWKDLESFATKPFKSFRKVKNIEKCLETTSVMAGIFWQAEWDNNPYITDTKIYHKLTPHEVRIIGVVNNCYVIQNSRGANIGDGGLWYFPKDIKFFHTYKLCPEPWSNLIIRLITLLT